MASRDSLDGRLVGGRFRLDKQLGEGGMARVYQGNDEVTHHPIAIKVLLPNLANDVRLARRFRHEAKAAARIDHPNAVKIIDYGIDEGLAYIAMELLVGRDLQSLVKADKPVDVWRAVDIAMQICDVLAAAHHAGILHRDLKPENVMVLGNAPNEYVKVLDFGLAKVFERKAAGAEMSVTQLTIAGATVGTPEFMSPEQCKGAKLDQRSDVYACGALLFYLLTGHAPFEASTPHEVMLKHVRQTPEAPSQSRADLPTEIDRIVLRALLKEPAARYQTAQHLQQALIKAASDASSSSIPSSRAPPPPPIDPVPRTTMPSASDDLMSEARALAAQIIEDGVIQPDSSGPPSVRPAPGFAVWQQPGMGPVSSSPPSSHPQAQVVVFTGTAERPLAHAPLSTNRRGLVVAAAVFAVLLVIGGMVILVALLRS